MNSFLCIVLLVVSVIQCKTCFVRPIKPALEDRYVCNGGTSLQIAN